MAKKRSKKQKKPGRFDDFPGFDPRGMEKTLSDLNRILEGKEFDSDEDLVQYLQEYLASYDPDRFQAKRSLDQAQELIYQAWELEGKERVELAYKALEISRDCADAYIILAEETARNKKEILRFYQQAVAAGRRALGEEVFKDSVGDFWSLLNTRPYMRALFGLAQSLWFLGKRRDAIEHYYELLRLNPTDNQGVRFVLITCLLVVGRDDDAKKLIDEYKNDPTATWAYSRALLLFRQKGASRKANALLKKALKVNHYVPEYLLKKKKFPRELPCMIGFGDENEAVDYAFDALSAWENTPGALKWLAENFNKL